MEAREEKEDLQIIWVFPQIGVPQNGWFIMENLIKMHDLGVPLFSETSILLSLFFLDLMICHMFKGIFFYP